jgi:hypothetical protein
MSAVVDRTLILLLGSIHSSNFEGEFWHPAQANSKKRQRRYRMIKLFYPKNKIL